MFFTQSVPSQALTSLILILDALLGRHQLLERQQETTGAGELLLLTRCFWFFFVFLLLLPSVTFCNLLPVFYVHVGSTVGSADVIVCTL